ncbi:membrane protein [Arthrobacter phage Reedo]|uniref:Uncharacterized protein n=1 Tax=Arthrobacter phage Reedo TaxID=2910755 RepID=A0AA49GZ96_9CAUD|nr:membrane protein [Arthrobacter phage Reedo]UJQ86847.1 hypothetical protein SEA_REEDO_57 [Arthrobacter phage Reedo]
MTPNWTAIWALTVAVVGALLLVGCDDGTASAPGPAVGPMIGYNGKVGVGFDLGNGVYMSPTGKLGYGF